MGKKAGTILRINLSSGKIEKEPLGENLRKDFLGGRGLNSKLLFDEVGPEVTPLSQDNKLIFGSSPLSGTPSPAAARFTVTAKSPLTRILGDANAGGNFGPTLKKAGYDHVIIEGKADLPTYIFIDGDDISLKPANNVWGKDTFETERIIKDEHNDNKIRVASIGQAGENLVKYAAVMHEERAAARTGMGAVMGSKNLKALAVRGNQEVEINNPKNFKSIIRNLHKKAMGSRLAKAISEFGGAGGTSVTNKIGILALRNYQQAGGYKDADKFNPKDISKEFYLGSKACYKCPIHCAKKWEIKEGPFAGEKGNKIEEGVFTPFGPVVHNAYLPAVFKMNNLVNQYGLDSLESGSIIATAMDWYEKGIITSKDTDGLELTWGNYEAVITILDKIAKREGFGDILADGIISAAEKIGKDAKKYISHCKGMTWGGIDIRIMKGLALCLATATRGCDHLRGRVPTETPGVSILKPDDAEERWGSKEVTITTSYKKAPVAIFYQHLAAVTDSLEICRFASESNGGGLEIGDMAELFSAVTGIKKNEEDMLRAGERIFNLERAYIVREGIRRKDDFLIGRWVEGGVPSGPFEGETIDTDKWNGMLDDFYQSRGWDIETGIPTESKLKLLGLDSVADNLINQGILPGR